MNRYVLYDNKGKILQYMVMQESAVNRLETDTEFVLEVSEPINVDTNWVENQTIIKKDELPITQNKQTVLADGIDEIVFSNFPIGVTVEWPDNVETIEEGNEIIFSVDLEGTYTFLFSLFPYLDKEITVEAIPAT